MWTHRRKDVKQTSQVPGSCQAKELTRASGRSRQFVQSLGFDPEKVIELPPAKLGPRVLSLRGGGTIGPIRKLVMVKMARTRVRVYG